MRLKRNPAAAGIIYEAACAEFGEANVQIDVYRQKSSESPRFPVIKGDDRIVWSVEESEILNSKLPVFIIECVYITREKIDAARKWLDKHRGSLLDVKVEEEI